MIFRKLYFQVLLAIVCGVFLGWIAPEFAIQLKPVSEAFIFGIKILVAPLIFTTVCLGISRSGSGKDAVRVGLRALIYFELVSTFALMIGLGVGNWVQPGAAFPITVAALDPTLVQNYVVKRGSILNPWESGLNLVQVLVVALVSGVGLLWARTEFRMRANSALEAIGNRGFRWMSLYMRMAPLGAAAAMAFTVGKFGFGALAPLASLMACFYLTCAGFVLLVLGTILVMIRVPVFRFFSYLKDEIILVLGTSSSESALAPLMGKLSRMGCDSKVVGLVVPTGYSFNLDGTNIYLTLAILFIAQAFGVQLGLPEQLEILLFAMVSSKGASGVTGAGFITLATTLSVVPEVPVVGLALILGVDRFMSEARAMTNMLGNAVGAVVIAHHEGAIDREALSRELGVLGA